MGYKNNPEDVDQREIQRRYHAAKNFYRGFFDWQEKQEYWQRSKYYVKDSHPAIVSAEVFDKVQEEMAKCASIVRKEDDTVEASGSKYNGKYILGNLLVCGDCGASYRRRTERGKVVWRCTTRIEKGKDACPHSPILDEEWVKSILGETVCGDSAYDESIIRNKTDRIQIFGTYIMICYKNGEQAKRLFSERLMTVKFVNY